MRHVIIILMLWAGAASASATAPEFVEKHVKKAEVVGQAMFTYYFWDVYKATLYAPQGSWSDSNTFALALTYQRDFEGNDIAKRSVKEMRQQGITDEQKLKRWGDTMRSLFPDVKEGETLTGVVTQNQSTLFYLNNSLIGEVEEREFTQRFFAIWLSEETSEPELRQKLLASNNSKTKGEQ